MARKISFQKVLNVDSRKAFEVITNLMITLILYLDAQGQL
jgi:hypothetical protein